jgi:hypothetical protein
MKNYHVLLVGGVLMPLLQAVEGRWAIAFMLSWVTVVLGLAFTHGRKAPPDVETILTGAGPYRQATVTTASHKPSPWRRVRCFLGFHCYRPCKSRRSPMCQDFACACGRTYHVCAK